MGVLHILGIPLRLFRSALGHLFEGGDTRLLLSLPVAGLEEATAAQILFTLRAAASTPEVHYLPTSHSHQMEQSWSSEPLMPSVNALSWSELCAADR